MFTLQPLAVLFGLGGQELLIILGIVLLIFGGSKIPQLARGLGQGMREFRNAAREQEEEDAGGSPPAGDPEAAEAPAEEEESSPIR